MHNLIICQQIVWTWIFYARFMFYFKCEWIYWNLKKFWEINISIFDNVHLYIDLFSDGRQTTLETKILKWKKKAWIRGIWNKQKKLTHKNILWLWENCETIFVIKLFITKNNYNKMSSFYETQCNIWHSWFQKNAHFISKSFLKKKMICIFETTWYFEKQNNNIQKTDFFVNFKFEIFTNVFVKKTDFRSFCKWNRWIK